MVHPVPTPFSIIDELNNIIIDGGNNQNLKLFNRGNDISIAPTIRGKSQFPKPPIKIGITIKKIITNPWAVTKELYNWSSPKNFPGCANSIRIIDLIEEPNIADQEPRIRYNVPISLWFVENNHRINKHKKQWQKRKWNNWTIYTKIIYYYF